MSSAGTPMGEGNRSSEPNGRDYHARQPTYDIGEEEQEERRARRAERVLVDKDTAEVIAGGSAAEVIAGAGAVTLGILGLTGLFPITFVSIAIICVGVGLIFAGGSIAAKYQDVLNVSEGRRSAGTMAEAGGGITAETVGGAGGVVLGVLALLGVEVFTLIPIAMIVLGGAMAFGAGAISRLSGLVIAASGAPIFKQRVARESVKSASALQLVIGLGAAVLGVLALLGVGATAAGVGGTTVAMTLNLVAGLALGGGLLLSGLAVGGKMINMLYKTRDESSADSARYDEARRPVYRQYRHDSDARPV